MGEVVRALTAGAWGPDHIGPWGTLTTWVLAPTQTEKYQRILSRGMNDLAC